MGQTGRFYDDLEAAFGKGNVTSGYRSQEEQDALVAAGKTKATRSSHTYEDGYDIRISAADSPEDIRRRAAERGLHVGNIRRESGQGRNQGTGPHWHVELSMAGPNAGGVPANSSRPGQGVANPQSFLDGLESQLGPEAMASGGVTTSAPGTFGSDAALQTRANNVDTALEQQGTQIDILTQVTDAAQAVQLAGMTQMVEDTREISDEISAGTEQLRRQVQPVFQARGRVADQLDQLNTMNPLERGLRSIFDLNYNRKFLENQLDHYDRTLEARASDYDYMAKLHNAALGEIERRYQLGNAIPGLAVAQTEEDLGIVGMRVQQTAGMLGSLRDRITAESQVISAKALARDDMLSRLDGPTVLGLANQAKSNNGLVTFNGVEFSYGELRDRLERDEDQELNREAHRMAIASSRMDMADKFATNIARSLTRQQAEAAIAAGGVWNGIQLPQDVLQNVYQNHIQTARIKAEELQTTMPATIALRTGIDELKRVSAIRTRTKNMFGGVGIPGVDTLVTNSTDALRQLTDAVQNGAPPEIITALTQRLAVNSANMDKALDAALLRQAGGNREAAGYMKSFVLGTPLDSAASIQALTYFAVRGAQPEGIAMSPESKQVFQQAQRITNRIRTANPKIGADTLRQQVATELNEYAGKTVGAARYERVNRDLPNIARRVGHPFGKMDEQQWSQVRATASATAYEAIARNMGIEPAQVRQMRVTGKPLTTDQAGQDMFNQFIKEVGNFNAIEQRALTDGVDQLPSIQPGRRNSSILIDFLGSTQLQGAAEAYTQAVGSESFGDYLVNPLAMGSLESIIGQEADGYRQVQADATRDQRATARATASGYGYNPYHRSLVILSGIEGVGVEGAKKLGPQIEAYIKTREGERTGLGSEVFTDNPGQGGLEWPNSRMVREENLILNFLQQSKFEDPALEAYRKTAVRGWANVATQSDSAMTTMVKILSGDF